MKLGILDWGIGGLGLYQLIKRDVPELAITYWSDAGATPYGKLAHAALRDRVTAVARELAAGGVTHLAVACNAASTVLPLDGTAPPSGGVAGRGHAAAIDGRCGLPSVTGVLEHGAAAARRTRGVVGIVGGRRTILSGAYRRALHGRDVRQRVAQPISAYVERGELTGHRLGAELDRIMGPLRGVETVVLACTHYPAILAAFAQRAPQARIIDPTEHLWAWMQRRWPVATMARGRDEFHTSGDAAAMRRAAKAAFGVRIARVRSHPL
jgi:glutamate racemase